jgi:hypothetical protein
MIRRLVDRTSPAACLVILLVFAYAGLSPFHAPQNGAKFLDTGNGVRFKGEGIVLSNGLFHSNSSQNTDCSVELWLKSADNGGSSTILDFYQASSLRQFVIRQDGNPLLQVLRSDKAGPNLIEFEHTFHPDDTRLITVASGAKGTKLYLDETAVQNSQDFADGIPLCSGQLSIGAAAISYDYWNGDVFGIAIYNSALTETQVGRDYEAWKAVGRLDLKQSDNLAALYTFNERSGSVVRNEVAGSPDLYIPPTFEVPGHPFLENPWLSSYPSEVNWKDVAINVVGFMPFGFFCFSCLSKMQLKNWSGFASILAGALVSLTIEVLQWYLPTRDSSLADVQTNVIGTALGIAVYRLTIGSDQGLEPAKK